MQQPCKGTLLVVDDHLEMARILAEQLTDAGYQVTTAQGGEAAISEARNQLFDCVICDLRMERVDGFDVLAAVHELDPGIPVLIMTAFGAIETAIEAIKRGAWHYLTKPFSISELLVWVERAIAERRLRDENRALRKLATERSSFGAMLGRSPRMRALYDLLERVSGSAAPVLVRGESGTGKELVARALHFNGPRRERPFVAVNCTALPEQLLESELFGHVRGAFTGATATRRGLLLEADGGTLFLDEVGDMPPALQVRLLRVLEDGEIRAVGSDAPRRVDVRIITATHQDLEQRVGERLFRQDLYYRLNVVPVAVPPLRERNEDIPLLCEHFLARAREKTPNARVARIAPQALAAFERHGWPGNVRELENLVERLVVVCPRETVELEDLQTFSPGLFAPPGPLESAKTQLMSLRQLDTEYITWVVSHCSGNKTRAAEILGIDVSTIHRRERSTG